MKRFQPQLYAVMNRSSVNVSSGAEKKKKNASISKNSGSLQMHNQYSIIQERC